MIKDGIIKVDQVIFVYSYPPKEALIGLVEDIHYPNIFVQVIPRSGGKNKFGKKQKIDISKNIALTIMNEKDIKKYLTTKEQKYLKNLKKDSEIVDLFKDEY